ncbi:TetR family transcriptional regulator [Amycolatopsis sp. K13G38]|uniref:TetR family transcriptional regulator n=1 Tax=Amycolatopsis acididurans TaxID=2724524 RepID=A0ABX1J302_9PSEU|nr:TetR family transcriptional regulator [Amycolatopsis acididurans]NKQ54180.1 TetR family transcriptional regulator [Amycolatopsis acididurans]
MVSLPERDRGGRPASTSAHELAELAQDLFLQRGFENVSVDDIAAAAGVSRRTFFRYFSTKADVLWVESPAEIARFRDLLAAMPPDVSYGDALCRAAPEALHHPAEQRTWALHRAELILTVPSVQEKAALRHTEWRRVATEFVALRRGTGPHDLVAIGVGHAVLAATLGAHEYWLAHPDEDLPTIMERLLRLLLPDR